MHIHSGGIFPLIVLYKLSSNTIKRTIEQSAVKHFQYLFNLFTILMPVNIDGLYPTSNLNL